MTVRPTIIEEPLITIPLLNEIRKYCEGCGGVAGCASAKSAAALQTCEKIKGAESILRQKAECPA